MIESFLYDMLNLLTYFCCSLQKKSGIDYVLNFVFFIFLFLISFIESKNKHKNDFTLVFHSTTSFTNPGRITDSFCERDVVIRLIKSAEKAIIDTGKAVQIIPLVKPGNKDLIDLAQLINRINPDVCFIFSAYKTENSIPECGFYWYVWDSIVSCVKQTDLVFIQESDAYRFSYEKTVCYADILKKGFSQSVKYWSYLFCSGFPTTVLRGIVSPAFLIEIGLPDESMAEGYGFLIGTIISMLVDNS